MTQMDARWELLLLDADPPVHGYQGLSSLTVGDVDGDGQVEILTGGEGALLWYRPSTFERGVVAEGEFGVGLALGDLDGDGLPEVVAGQRGEPPSIAWFEPGSDLRQPWARHVIDAACAATAHDLLFADLDGDGEVEIVVGEHDPFQPYRSRCRLMVYRKAEPLGRAWVRHVLDGRFEHHVGTRVFEVAPGRLAIASHGWVDSRYVHLWVPD